MPTETRLVAGRSRGPGCLVRQCPHAAQAKACGLGRALGVGRSELCRRRLLPTSAGWQPHVGPGVCGARCPGVRAGPYEFALKTRSCVIRGGKYSLRKSSCAFFLAIGFHMTQRGSKVLPEINAPQVMGIGPELTYFSISQYKR